MYRYVRVRTLFSVADHMGSEGIQIDDGISKAFSTNIANARTMSSQMVDVRDVVLERETAVLALFRVSAVVWSMMHDTAMVDERLPVVEDFIATAPHKLTIVDIDLEWRHAARFHCSREICSIVALLHMTDQIRRASHL